VVVTICRPSNRVESNRIPSTKERRGIRKLDPSNSVAGYRRNEFGTFRLGEESDFARGRWEENDFISGRQAFNVRTRCAYNLQDACVSCMNACNAFKCFICILPCVGSIALNRSRAIKTEKVQRSMMGRAITHVELDSNGIHIHPSIHSRRTIKPPMEHGGGAHLHQW
jgi:hypothetical protein